MTKLHTTIKYEDHTGRKIAHIFLEDDLWALDCARLTGRPLLLTGEPGSGKSQFARAAAEHLGFGFCQKVVDGHTRSRELLWEEDLIERLAKAQAMPSNADPSHIENVLKVSNFVTPGVLWWGFNASSAHDQFKEEPTQSKKKTGQSSSNDEAVQDSYVVLIDEIDKAESDVPNGLLEALGDRRFMPPGQETYIEAQNMPLVVVTSNEERSLPPAFLRRCVVHNMNVPEGEYEYHLILRGKARFEDAAASEIIEKCARMTVEDRQAAIDEKRFPAPGQAEFFDLLTAVFGAQKEFKQPVDEIIGLLSRYTTKKYNGLK